MSAACPETKQTTYYGLVQCTEGAGHEKCHASYRDGALLCAWLTPAEFQAAKDRGEFDRKRCSCADPIPVCDDCGGEIL